MISSRSRPRSGVFASPYDTRGWLRKRGRLMPTWKTRFFVLTPQGFSYYDDEFCCFVRGHDQVVSCRRDPRLPLHLLLTSGSGRVFQLACLSAKDQDLWMAAFGKAAAARRGSTTGSDSTEAEPALRSSLFASASASAEPPTSTRKSSIGVDNFKLISTLGKGGFGKVLKVSKLDRGGDDTGKVYAMKILKKDFVVKNKMKKTTMLEKQILLDITHPFVVKLHYSFQTAHKLYMVMDYYGGGSLYYHLSRETRFEEDVVRFFGAEIVLAVQHLHDHGIVYRDLKLENVLLDGEGHIALTDFGLSKTIDPLNRQFANTFCGTPLYVAPEMVRRRKYGFGVDWWALGVMLYELLSSKVPFASRSAEKVLWKIVNTEPTFVPGIFSAGAQSLIAGLLNKSPTRRLGHGPGAGSARNIMKHKFFADFDFEKCVRKELVPPFTPAATYQGEKNVRGMEAKDTQYMDLADGAGAGEEFDRFTYCQSAEYLVPMDETVAESPDKEPTLEAGAVDAEHCTWVDSSGSGSDLISTAEFMDVFIDH